MPLTKPSVAASALLVSALSPGCAEGCLTPAPGLCAYEGQPLQLGERVPLEDGCNDCTCLSTGELDCSERICASPDGGSPFPDDAGPPAAQDAGAEDAGPARPPSDCVDADADGFYDCLDPNYPEWPQVVDCDDERWFVQPGGYDYPDNGIDDDCDDEIDEAPACSCAPDGHGVTAEQALAALDLCDETVVSVTRAGDGRQLGVYGSYYGEVAPQEGGCLAVLSTGIAGETALQTGENEISGCFFNDPDPAAPGDDVCDLAQLRITLRPPSNARGVELSFMFLSSEWPEWLCDDYNDTFYTLYTSEAVNGGAQSNISFDAEQREITVNVGFFEQPRGWTVPLDDTPFGFRDEGVTCAAFSLNPTCALPDYCDDPEVDLGFVGSGSGWLVTRAPFAPGEETLELVFSIHDEGDGRFDSAVLLDGLKWVPYRPPVSTTKN